MAFPVLQYELVLSDKGHDEAVGLDVVTGYSLLPAKALRYWLPAFDRWGDGCSPNLSGCELHRYYDTAFEKMICLLYNPGRNSYKRTFKPVLLRGILFHPSTITDVVYNAELILNPLPSIDIVPPLQISRSKNAPVPGWTERRRLLQAARLLKQ